MYSMSHSCIGLEDLSPLTSLLSDGDLACDFIYVVALENNTFKATEDILHLF